MSKTGGRTSPKKLERIQRDALIVNLRRAGLSLPEIGERVGLTKAMVFRIVTNAMRAHAADILIDAKELVGQEVDRLNKLQSAIWDTAIGGDLKAVQMAIRIIDLRRSILGIGKAVGAEPTPRHNFLGAPTPSTSASLTVDEAGASLTVSRTVRLKPADCSDAELDMLEGILLRQQSKQEPGAAPAIEHAEEVAEGAEDGPG